MTAPLLYFEVDPPPDLAHVVLSFWGFEVRDAAAHAHTLWPDASLSITWGMHRGRTIILGGLGARLEPVAVPVQPGAAFRGIRFWPDATKPLFGIDPRAARGRRLPLDALGVVGARLGGVAREATSLSDAFPIFEAALRDSLTSAGTIDSLVRRALHAIDAQPEGAVGTVASSLGVSDRQLRRRFGSATGLSLKEYARIRRLRRTLERVVVDGESNWSSIAARSGFADQPHLVNEIVRMTAYTPRLLEQRLRLIEHVGVKP
jgi:AraC-like DNA-binding protein